MKRLSAVALSAALIFSGCKFSQTEDTKPNEVPEISGNAQGGEQISLADLLKVQPVLAAGKDIYQPVQVTPALKESEADPSKAKNLELMEKALGLQLTSAQKDFLQKNKFLLLDNFADAQKFCFQNELLTDRANCSTHLDSILAPPDYMLALLDAFQGSNVDFERTPANALYINSDVILHTYHVFLDRYFKRLEERQLFPLLQGIVTQLQQTAFAALAQASQPEEKNSLERVAAYLTIGKVLLETTTATKPPYFSSPEEETTWRNQEQTIDQTPAAFLKNLEQYQDKFSPKVYEEMKAELDFIVAAKTMAISPLFSIYGPTKPTDYTQFTPRSHYNESSILRAYFRAMILFGRQSFPFNKTEGLQDAAVLTNLLQKSGKAEDWAKFSDVTDFLAGASDDITYKQFKTSLETALGKNSDIPTIFQAGNLEKMKQEAGKLPNPKILSEVIVDENIGNMTKEDLLLQTKGLRLFGQKFTFDAWILNQMTAGQEKTDIALPSTPSAIFVAGALGSDVVEKALPTWIQENAPELSSPAIWQKLLMLRGELQKVSTQDWLGNVSSAWLWTLSPLLEKYGAGYPAFMQAALYPVKNLQTVLGSYTELKHDTLLYAKQSYAELGAGGPDEQKPPEIVKGFVDPDMEFWNRIITLTEFTRVGLQSRGLLEEDVNGRLQDFLQNLRFYQGFAQKELTNAPISDVEYEDLRTNFWHISQLIAPFDGEIIEEKDKKPALIADIHTDAVKSQVLYEATGNPLIMLAFVSDQGTPRLVIGTAYRHFELTGPLDRRFTDEEWKKRVDDNDLPATPSFYKELFLGK